MQLKCSFEPVVDLRTRLLVLGSLPGEVSLAQSRYYAHPRNQFWRLMSLVADCELAHLPYDGRLQILLRRGIGLWDVVASAARVGSLDSNIRNHVPNELAALCNSLPRLEAVAFNGRKAATIGHKLLAGNAGLQLIDLPSSSPAFTLALDRKAERWRELKQWLATAEDC